MAHYVQGFTRFYAACRPEWVEVEDPVLLQRLAAYQQALSKEV